MYRIVVVAGRRIDAPGSPERFPAKNRDLVCARIADRLRAVGATVVVASAASGADLLALQAARALKLRVQVILPFEAARFRKTSVIDRPGDFGAVFDDVCRAAGPNLVVLRNAGESDVAYAAVNRALLDTASALAGGCPTPTEVLVLLVWERERRARGDLTADLGEAARARGWAVDHIATR
jgi:hypothetical protein